MSVTQWTAYAQEAQAATGVPANVILGLIDVESGGQPGLTSKAGANGITQFMPGTAREYGVNTSPGGERSQVMGAARYLKALGWNNTDKAAQTKALASYNAGPGNWGAGLGYASNVLTKAKAYLKQNDPSSQAPTSQVPAAITAAGKKDSGEWALRQLVGFALVVAGLGLFYFGGARILGVRGSAPIRNAARGAALVAR
ncbi:MAG TPA: transglycosylase SLT domain-containing protein [Polyangia bacterium]|nr:transglycosylase SLT domain-containing protein [Polyangia bacterium]